jgi:hypothetical protein
MTEAKWLGSVNPLSMLAHVRTGSARKLRLFACAGCRLLWDFLPDVRSRQAVEAAEEWADGLIGRKELQSFRTGAEAALRAAVETPIGDGYAHFRAAQVAVQACIPRKDTVLAVSYLVSSATLHPSVRGSRSFGDKLVCDLIRDLFGNPFRPSRIDPAWLTWGDGTVPKLVRAIYDERAFDRLPVVADALEDAGCAVPVLLGHCRGTDPHARGCWLLDHLLGKE